MRHYNTSAIRIRGFVRWRWLVLITLILLAPITDYRAYAEPEHLELKIEAGYGGKFKQGRSFPVMLTITNRAPEEIKGELVLQTARTQGGKDISYTARVELPSGSSKQVWMTLPGERLSKENNEVVFYEGTAENGNKRNFSGGRAFVTADPYQWVFIAVLANDPDTLNQLALLNNGGISSQVMHWETEEVPAGAGMLDSLDVMVLNNMDADRLRTDQIEAIQSWVRKGGTLILAGGAGYPKSAKPFEQLSPVNYAGTKSITQLSVLEKAGGKPLALPNSLTVSEASLRSDSELVYAEGGIPIIAKRAAGYGAVWYIAYDLSLEPMASWEGNISLWQKLLGSLLFTPGAGSSMIYYGGQMGELSRTLHLFPSLSSPSMSLLAGLFIAYILLAAPVLYWILLKLDKREWAWICIPAVSIVSSIVIFFVGASDKTTAATHTMSFVELDGEGNAYRTSAAAVFLPSSGSHEIRLAGAGTISPGEESDVFGRNAGELVGESDTYVYQHEDQSSSLTWQDVPFWSLRKAMIEMEDAEAAGRLKVTAYTTKQGITGEVTNDTEKDLKDAAVVVYQLVHPLGELKQGETKSFTITTAVTNGSMDIASLLYPYPGTYDDNKFARQRSMVNWLFQHRPELYQRPLVIGWNESKEASYSVDGKKVRGDELSLWTQPFTFTALQGEQIAWPSGTVQPKIVSHTLQMIERQSSHRYVIGRGEVTVSYDLTGPENAVYEKVKLTGRKDSVLTVYIYHRGKEEWEEWNGGPYELQAPVSDYLGGEQMLLLRASTADNHIALELPVLSAEGKVQP